jgi:taurine--2-oxoglutarate transaminase
MSEKTLGMRAAALDQAHVFHSWSAQASLNPLMIAGGEGRRVWDFDGKTYLDFSSQLVNTNLGHGHPKIVEAIQQQAQLLATVAPAHGNAARSEAAAKIIDHSPSGFAKVFFTNGGADANENAIRMARLVTGRDKILSSYRSYHGNTGAAVVATGDWRRVPNEYARGHVHFFGPFPYRSEFWADSPEVECARALEHLQRVIAAEGPDSIAAILLEPIPGTAGVIVPPEGYLAGVRELANQHGILLILDEVMSGFGRAGSWFAHEEHAVVPDLITFAKGVNSGYVPVGGVIISEPIAAVFDHQVFPGGLTYSGHPLAMASIIAAITAMEAEDTIGHAKQIGATRLGPGLRRLQQEHPSIGDVRGVGVFWALDLVTDRRSREPISADTLGQVRTDLLARGLLPFTVGNRLHIVPPCNVTAEEIDEGLGILDEALKIADLTTTTESAL